MAGAHAAARHLHRLTIQPRRLTGDAPIAGPPRHRRRRTTPRAFRFIPRQGRKIRLVRVGALAFVGGSLASAATAALARRHQHSRRIVGWRPMVAAAAVGAVALHAAGSGHQR